MNECIFPNHTLFTISTNTPDQTIANVHWQLGKTCNAITMLSEYTIANSSNISITNPAPHSSVLSTVFITIAICMQWSMFMALWWQRRQIKFITSSWMWTIAEVFGTMFMVLASIWDHYTTTSSCRAHYRILYMAFFTTGFVATMSAIGVRSWRLLKLFAVGCGEPTLVVSRTNQVQYSNWRMARYFFLMIGLNGVAIGICTYLLQSAEMTNDDDDITGNRHLNSPFVIPYKFREKAVLFMTDYLRRSTACQISDNQWFIIAWFVGLFTLWILVACLMYALESVPDKFSERNVFMVLRLALLLCNALTSFITHGLFAPSAISALVTTIIVTCSCTLITASSILPKLTLPPLPPDIMTVVTTNTNANVTAFGARDIHQRMRYETITLAPSTIQANSGAVQNLNRRDLPMPGNVVVDNNCLMTPSSFVHDSRSSSEELNIDATLKVLKQKVLESPQRQNYMQAAAAAVAEEQPRTFAGCNTETQKQRRLSVFYT